MIYFSEGLYVTLLLFSSIISSSIQAWSFSYNNFLLIYDFSRLYMDEKLNKSPAWSIVKPIENDSAIIGLMMVYILLLFIVYISYGDR